jgi:hypothetical protein
MHHLIYPQQDTYITNLTGLESKNFGITEILQVGTKNIPQRVLSATKTYVYVNATFAAQGFTYFTGIFTGSLSSGSVTFAKGNISGSSLEFTSSYFSGSIDGISIEKTGSISGSLINGLITGSLTVLLLIGIFTGQLTGSNACLTGTGTGTDIVNQQNWTTTNVQFIERSLLKFDLTAISKSIVSGTIVNPSFALKLKIADDCDLPIAYNIYALPISQSWVMGNGYWSDGGSDEGVSWLYRDLNRGTPWYSPYASESRLSIDFINNPLFFTASFAYGGGTWYTSSWCSQSFQYKSADIDMDVTPMVMSWLNKSIPNEGIILVSSDELQATGSGFTLKFFSRDTNTIYYPLLDVMWDDIALVGFITGSVTTSSATVSSTSGISAIIQSGSSFTIVGGVDGIFSGSSFIITTTDYITASNQIFNPTVVHSACDHDNWHANNNWPVGYFVDIDQWSGRYYTDGITPGAINRGYDVYGWGNFRPNWDEDEDVVPQDLFGTEIHFIPYRDRSWHRHHHSSRPTYGNAYTYLFTGSFTGSFEGTASYVAGTLTGSGAYDFTVDYFSGSLDTSSSVELSYSEITASVSINGIVSGSMASATYVGLYRGLLNSPSILLNGTGSGYYLDTTFCAFNGFIDGRGLRGNIARVPVKGSVRGYLTISQSVVIAPCGNSFTTSFTSGSFLTGPFAGDTFTSYYIDHVFENAHLTGSWNPNTLLGVQVYIPLPSEIDPYVYAYVNGTYISGKALGTYVTSGFNSASFYGQFISGSLIGGYLNLQLSGSVYTSSFFYTSSVTFTSSIFNALDVERPFSIALQNVQPTYKAGDIAKIVVFGRKKFPLKYFGITTQQTQYLIPEYLPPTSYYALKDNETDEIIVNFDSYTKIGCEYPNGNYFLLDTTSLPQDRYYRLLIRVEDGNTVQTVDTGKTFKLVR